MVNAKDKEYKDIRLIFVLDVSRSMIYAEDIPPNRLTAMKQQVKDFYLKLDGIYECSILPFAGDANPYFCPLTKSRSSFVTMLDELDWRSAPSFGTDLNKAMESVRDVYVKQDKIDKSGFNIIILISDGGKEEAIAVNRIQLLKVSRELANKNFKIYTIGVGGDKPCPLVLRDSKGSFIDYVNENGRIATSQLDEEILRQLADIGHGKYYNLNASAALASDLKEIVIENQALVTERIRPEKLPLQGYLFSVTVCLLFGCLLLNKI
jgi:Ca-activated chloride channel family protein